MAEFSCFVCVLHVSSVYLIKKVNISGRSRFRLVGYHNSIAVSFVQPGNQKAWCYQNCQKVPNVEFNVDTNVLPLTSGCLKPFVFDKSYKNKVFNLNKWSFNDIKIFDLSKLWEELPFQVTCKQIFWVHCGRWKVYSFYILPIGILSLWNGNNLTIRSCPWDSKKIS